MKAFLKYARINRLRSLTPNYLVSLAAFYQGRNNKQHSQYTQKGFMYVGGGLLFMAGYSYLDHVKRRNVCGEGDEEADGSEFVQTASVTDGDESFDRSSMLQNMQNIASLYAQRAKEVAENKDPAMASELFKGKGMFPPEIGEDTDKNLKKLQGSMDLMQKSYRVIKLGRDDLLYNGQLIQLAISNPENRMLFHPLNKVILCKYNDSYYAFSSFCGYDYTNLAQGAFLGNKIICPTCASVYDVTDGSIDQGPSFRGLASYFVQNKEGKLQLLIPGILPTFSLPRSIEKLAVDPRTFVIIGDNETALSAIQTLRCVYSGKIVLFPTQTSGQFENKDIFSRKLGPLTKEEVALVENDFFQHHNVEVVREPINKIDAETQTIHLGKNKNMRYEKLLFACGSTMKKLGKNYSNVYYLEDYESHANAHNAAINAKHITILGSTFEAYQTAASLRSYLDSVGIKKTKIVIFDTETSEPQKTFGYWVHNLIIGLLKKHRISVITGARLKNINGEYELKSILFKKSQDDTDYYMNTDMVIVEGKLDIPKISLQNILAVNSFEPVYDVSGIVTTDSRFAIHHNNLFSNIYAAGSCAQYPSFLSQQKFRTSDIKYNIEAGFYAALQMLDKRVEFNYISVSRIQLFDKTIYYVGERNPIYQEVVITGDPANYKFVAYFINAEEVIGFMTCGFSNLHLYMLEAMKQFQFPPAKVVRAKNHDYRDIARRTLSIRKNITCKRKEILQIASVISAETETDEEKLNTMKDKFKARYKDLKKESDKRVKEEQEKAKNKQNPPQAEEAPKAIVG